MEELTHFQKLDIEKQKQAHLQEMAKIKAEAEVQTAKERTAQLKIQRRLDNATWIRCMQGWGLAIVVVFAGVWGGWQMWGHNGPKTVDELKQERFNTCLKSKDFDGAPKQVWYPDYANGQGLCLPRDKQLPSEAK